MPTVTPQSTKVKNRLREENPGRLRVRWRNVTFQSSEVYFRDGFRRHAVWRFRPSDDSSLRIHYDEGQAAFVGIDLADGDRVMLSAESVQDGIAILSEN